MKNRKREKILYILQIPPPVNGSAKGNHTSENSGLNLVKLKPELIMIT